MRLCPHVFSFESFFLMMFSGNVHAMPFSAYRLHQWFSNCATRTTGGTQAVSGRVVSTPGSQEEGQGFDPSTFL